MGRLKLPGAINWRSRSEERDATHIPARRNKEAFLAKIAKITLMVSGTRAWAHPNHRPCCCLVDTRGRRSACPSAKQLRWGVIQ